MVGRAMIRYLVVALFALGLVVDARTAMAAPQILAVAASSEPLPLRCAGGVCEVEVSAMCLQKDRRFPDSQTVYYPHDAQSFTLVFKDADGIERRIVAGDTLTIRSKRTFTAVRFSIDEDTLTALNAQEAALHIAGGASLIPEGFEGDWYPQTEQDVATATGPYRELAAGWLDLDDERTRASRLISHVLNDLATDRDISRTDIDTAWSNAVARTANLDGDALARANDIRSRCGRLSSSDSAPGIVRCLERNHDSLLYKMNVEYWDAVKAGS